MTKIKLIYNPNAGVKRELIPGNYIPSLKEIKDLLKRYKIVVEVVETKGPGDATVLAKKSIEEGFKVVLVAGGDGTVNEVVNGLVGSEVTLGILPIGSVMNIARMLAVPLDIERAITLLKIGRTIRIDVGKISSIRDNELDNPKYFVETAGIGTAVTINGSSLVLTKGNFKGAFNIIKAIGDFYIHAINLRLDDKRNVKSRAFLITISNGPITGLAWKVAPKAKLNDHFLTVSLYKWTIVDFLQYLVHSNIGMIRPPKVDSYKVSKVSIFSKKPRIIHIDGREYDYTPVELEVVPNSLNVICGFPSEKEASFLEGEE